MGIVFLILAVADSSKGSEIVKEEGISTALANPGILSVIPTENGRSREVGTRFSVGEDYFKYGEMERKQLLFCPCQGVGQF